VTCCNLWKWGKFAYSLLFSVFTALHIYILWNLLTSAQRINSGFYLKREFFCLKIWNLPKFLSPCIFHVNLTIFASRYSTVFTAKIIIFSIVHWTAANVEVFSQLKPKIALRPPNNYNQLTKSPLLRAAISQPSSNIFTTLSVSKERLQ
jgi:hypothetical protein